jgi:tRNA 2-thiouridine synthesizing protein C
VPAPRKKILLLCRRAPYAGLLPRSGLDAALAAAVFEQELSVLFMDDGIWQLLPDQQPSDIDYKNIAGTLESMPLYDIERLHVDAESLRQRGVDASTLGSNTVLVSGRELPEFLDGFDQVWSF